MSAINGSRDAGQHADKDSRTKVVPKQPETSERDLKTPSPVDDFLSLQRVVGNRGVQSLLGSGKLSAPIQAKLTVGEADDVYEQEADQVAHDVMTMPDPVQREAAPEEEELAMKRIQREGIPEEEELAMKRIQREDIPEEEELAMKRIQREEVPEEEELALKRLQTKAAATPDVTYDTENKIESLRGSGHALPNNTREFFEPRFGQDFSSVNIHTGPDADALNRSLDARAFATGGDIFFRSGEYDPDSSGGRELLGHELTHVVQQGASTAIERKPDEHDS